MFSLIMSYLEGLINRINEQIEQQKREELKPRRVNRSHLPTEKRHTITTEERARARERVIVKEPPLMRRHITDTPPKRNG
jgi:hypothetical protein